MMNPELRRNLWLEITAHRLLAMPAVLGLAFLVLAALDKPGAVENVSLLALTGFGLLAGLWGSRLAANSIIDEMIDKTWDWQRLSTLTPWTMTWGKLVGSTAFAWYGSLICLAVFLVTATATNINSPLRFGVSIVLLAVMLQAAGIAAALHGSRSGAPARQRSVGILLVLLLLSGPAFGYVWMKTSWREAGPFLWITTVFVALTSIRIAALAYGAFFFGPFTSRLAFSTYAIAVMLAPLILIEASKTARIGRQPS